ncbi:MAG: metabolite traffic protein EboE [Planctomycetota bacterium]|jgi:hypothetical protein|nr:metabolite traffic protein EboE [Planctomycetota bacterium]
MSGVDRANLLATGRHPLTYCTNVHPADDLAAAEAVYRELAAPALRNALGEGPICLGAWWPADVARALAGDEARLRAHGDLLVELGLVPMSLNVFPLQRFHGDGVKASVYDPSWEDETRLEVTINAATAMAVLLERAGIDHGVLSTLPLGFRGADRTGRPTKAHARNVFCAALALERLRDERGVHLVLALEPEPWCVLETISETVTWIADEALAVAARNGNEAAVRRHVGVCIDLCHAAVVGEDPVVGVELCSSANVRVGKVQISAALVGRGPAGRDALVAFDEPVYLHQAFARDARVGPFVDLSEPALRDAELPDDCELVSHFHVPIHEARMGELTTTHPQVTAFLDAVANDVLPVGVPLEVETYTNPQIADEVAFAANYLLGR